MPRFRYNRAKGQFRTWLARLTKWRIKDQWRKRRPQAEHASAPGDTRSSRTATVARIADPRSSDLEALWDQELEHGAINWRSLNSRTWSIPAICRSSPSTS